MPPAFVGFRFLGFAELARGLSFSGRSIDASLERQMRLAVLEVAGQSARYITGSRATNPADLLGVRSGRLRQAVVTSGRVVKRSSGQFEGTVGTSRVIYGPIHELGGIITFSTGKTTRIPARPYLSRGLADKQDRIVQLLGRAYTGKVVFGGGGGAA